MTCTVEIAFGIDPFDDTSLGNNANWVDVTSALRGPDTGVFYRTATRSSRFDVFVAGTATIRLDNRDREFDPSYASSTYVGDFKRNTPIRIIGTHSGTDYVQWYGYVNLWTPEYPAHRDSVTVVEATDAMGLLGRYELDQLTTASYEGDTAGGRIGRVLDLLGFPSAYRDLDEGPALASTTWGTNALTECQQAAMSAGGFLYVQRDGTLTFDSIDALVTTRQLTSQVTYSSSFLQQPPPVRTGVGEGYRNLVRVGGGAVTTVEIDNVGANEAPIVFERTDLLMAEQARAQSMSEFYADLYGTETPFTSMIAHTAATVTLPAYQSALFLRKLRDRVTVTFSPPGGGSAISDEVFIDGIEGRCSPDRWDITHLYSSADAYDDNLDQPPANWWVWDSSTWDGGDYWSY